MGDGRSGDARREALRYRLERLDETLQDDIHPDQRTPAESEAARRDEPPRETSAVERAAYVETAIQQAIRRGEFDDLPGAGKPLPGLDGRHDPDWWIRRKIERERLTGLGPPALTLRTEDAGLDARLDGLHRESEVREVLDDFNRRVREARLQLLGGPPVITPLREVDAELAAWRERRAERERRRAEAQALREAEDAARSPRERRRRRREERRAAREAGRRGERG